MAYKCNICGFSAEKREDLLEHMFAHTSSGGKDEPAKEEPVYGEDTVIESSEPAGEQPVKVKSIFEAPSLAAEKSEIITEHGEGGRVLWVDLTTGQLTRSNPDPDVLEDYIGGRGWGVKTIYDILEPGVDPFSPENLLIFATGPLSATSAPTSGRYSVITKSPLTGTIADSSSGGTFSPNMRGAGFDYVVISGRSEKPVYLWLNNGRAELRDAAHLWGKDVFEADDAIKSETDPGAVVACIGPAGEKLSLIAAIVNDTQRAAGRNGVGAVMGSKRLKAVVARGNVRTQPAEAEAFSAANKDAQEAIKENPITGESLPKYGTAVLVNIINENGGFPTRNFMEGVFEGAGAISGESISEQILDEKYGCWGCPIKCGRKTTIKKGNFAGESGGGPEYETVWSLGACCGISDLSVVTKAHYMCNQYGLDAISAGVTISTLMELYQKGFVTDNDLDGGPQPRFGRSAVLLKYLELMAYRRGLGEILAQGSLRLAKRFGAPEVSMTVKGQELPGYDPRGYMGHALSYATSNRGGCHLRAYMISTEVLGVPEDTDRFKTEEKGSLLKTFQDRFTAVNALGVCIFTTFALNDDHYAGMLSAYTGKPETAESFLKAGERIYNLERMFNQREGFGRKDDTLPSRFLNEPLAQGASSGKVVPLDRMLDEYYDERGWDSDGNPTQQKKAELGL